MIIDDRLPEAFTSNPHLASLFQKGFHIFLPAGRIHMRNLSEKTWNANVWKIFDSKRKMQSNRTCDLLHAIWDHFVFQFSNIFPKRLHAKNCKTSEIWKASCSNVQSKLSHCLRLCLHWSGKLLTSRCKTWVGCMAGMMGERASAIHRCDGMTKAGTFQAPLCHLLCCFHGILTLTPPFDKSQGIKYPALWSGPIVTEVVDLTRKVWKFTDFDNLIWTNLPTKFLSAPAPGWVTT